MGLHAEAVGGVRFPMLQRRLSARGFAEPGVLISSTAFLLVSSGDTGEGNPSAPLLGISITRSPFGFFDRAEELEGASLVCCRSDRKAGDAWIGISDPATR